MSKILIVAEKQKVANEFLKLPRFRGCQRVEGSKPYFGYFENDKYIVTWARGHLLEVLNPEEYDPKYKQFRFEDLPILIPIKYRPKDEYIEQLNYVTELMQRSDVDHIINAADNDKEGELIFREIYDYSGVNKRVSRIFKSSHEAEELEAALNGLLPGSQFDSLAEAARARQYLDYILGITVTRASTTKLANNQFLLSSGRIQMCLLAEIRNRELEIANFKSKTFYTLSIKTQHEIEAALRTDIEYLNQEPLVKLGQSLKGKTVKVLSFEETESKSQPKQLFNLTDIYKEAIKQFNANTTVVQKHIQNLYDSGYITYPRTDSRHLPMVRLEKVQAAYQQLKSSSQYESLANLVPNGAISGKNSAFNDKKVTAHYAVVPTSKRYEPEGRPDLEKQLYDMIVKRFLGRFMPNAIYLVRKLELEDPEGNVFSVAQKILKTPGYLAIFKEEIDEDTKQEFTLPILSEGEMILVNDYIIKEGKARKPSLHNEVSILSFMENAGKYIEDEDTSRLLKGKRIGTSATEHTFIPKLLERKFIESNDKGYFSTTNIGRLFIDTFPVNDLKNPEFTAELEGTIESIIEGEISLDQFIQKTNDLAISIVQEIGAMPEGDTKNVLNAYNQQIEICTCLCKKGKLLDKGNFYGCSQFPECDVKFPMKIKGKSISREQIKKLVEKGTTDLIKGFKTEDNTFDAFIILEGKGIKFRFPTTEDKSIGQCPKCKNGHIVLIETKDKRSFYGCSNYRESNCNFQFPHILLGVKIPASQVKKYLKNGHTDFISGFQKDGGKEFTAALVMNDTKDNFSFHFPSKEDKTIGKCPLCSGAVLIGKQFYLCEKYKNGCDFIIPGSIFGKNITSSHVKKILENNLTDLIKGFKKKDGSGTYDAKLSYSVEEKRIKLVFPSKK